VAGNLGVKEKEQGARNKEQKKGRHSSKLRNGTDLGGFGKVRGIGGLGDLLRLLILVCSLEVQKKKDLCYS
jgi:hypothetical protein